MQAIVRYVMLLALCCVPPVGYGLASVPLFYSVGVWLDWKRLVRGYPDPDFSVGQLLLALPLFPVFRVIDVIGMLRAFLLGPVKDGWGGYGT